VTAVRHLEDLVEFIRNGLSLSNRNGVGGIPITRIETISDHAVDPARVGYAGVESGERDEWLLQPGDILFSHINSVSHLGKCALYEGVPRQLLHGMNLLNIRPRSSVVLPQYLVRALRSAPFRAQLAKHIKPAVNQASVSISALRTLSIAVPELPHQRRIADLLDKADAVRRKRREAIALTDELLRSAFLEMFGDPATNPRRWELKPLAALGRITTGNTPSRAVAAYFGVDIEWIKSDNINTPRHYLTRASEGLSAEGRAVGRVAPAGSSLITCIAGSPDCIGNVGLADRDVAFNQQINAITPHEGVDCRFLYVLLLVGKSLVQAASTKSMKGMVSKGKLEQLHVPAPPPQLQRKFGETFDNLMRLSQRQESAARDAEQLFQATVQGAFPTTSLTRTSHAELS
jgi:type I restriction enzyme S subunit